MLNAFAACFCFAGAMFCASSGASCDDRAVSGFCYLMAGLNIAMGILNIYCIAG